MVDDKTIIGYCELCGTLSNQVCGQCKKIRYCDREHQQLDWIQGNHKQHCNSGTLKPDIFTKWLKSFRFPEFELEEEEEPEKPIVKITEEMEDLLKPHQGDADIIDEEETEIDVDKAFLKFQKRVSLAPDQILRYGRVNPEGFNQEPLYVSDQKDFIVPNCECGAERTFEFQITPQLLSFLEVDNKAEYSLDWGTLLVYTCKNHCDRANGGYAQEFVFNQAFSSAGLGDRVRKELADRESLLEKELSSTRIEE